MSLKLLILTSLVIVYQSLCFKPIVTSIKETDYNGESFHDMRFPSEEQLSQISLQDFAQLRPSLKLYKKGRHFAYLFSRHPEISRLDPELLSREEVINGWRDLWCRERPDPACRKLTQSMIDLLEAHPRIDQDLKDEIMHVCRRVRNTRNDRTRLGKIKVSSDPSMIEKRIEYLERQRAYNLKRKKFIRCKDEKATEFSKMLEREMIPLDLRPEALEEKTRQFRKSLGDAASTSHGLHQFMIARKWDSKEIFRAMLARRKYNARHRTSDVRREQIQVEKSMKDRDGETDFDVFQRFVQASEWWKL